MSTYNSLFTGPEIDASVEGELGTVYGEYETPGCRLLGTEQANPTELRSVVIAGAYTIYFFYDGPTQLTGTSPIRMHVYYGVTPEVDGNTEGLIQTILCGAVLYWRDLFGSDATTRYDWNVIDLGVQQITVIDNLLSTNVSAALSANMGRFLLAFINGLSISGENMLINSGFTHPETPYLGWSLSPTVTLTGDFLSFESNPKIRLVKVDNSLSTSGDMGYIQTAVGYHPNLSSLPMEYTASVYIPSVIVVSDYVEVFIQIGFLDSTKTSYLGFEKKILHLTAEMCATTLQKLTVTATSPIYTGGFIDVSYGVVGTGTATFGGAKLNLGHYATGWSPSYTDQYNEFINAIKIREIPIHLTDIADQQALVYTMATADFTNVDVAIGGGGGFIASATEPLCKKVLWYNLSDLGGKFYRYDTTLSTPAWVKCIKAPFDRTTTPTDIERFQLDISTEDAIHPAGLKYWDPETLSWRLVGASPGKCYDVSLIAPSNNELLWVHSTTHLMRYYDTTNNKWELIHAAWGE